MLVRNRNVVTEKEITLEEKLAFLGQPGVYPNHAENVTVKETHMSWVFLVNDFVYKLKKPVAYDQFDHRTMQSRLINSREEVRINRELARNVYLGIVPLVLNKKGELQLEGEGAVVDWLVRMKRLPEESMLDYAISHDAVSDEQAGKVAALLVQFYQTTLSARLPARPFMQRMKASIQQTFAKLSQPLYALPPLLLQTIRDGLLLFIHDHSSLFRERIQQKRIIDAHGDLRPEHICLKPEPLIIDRLEFSKDLRLMDTAEELSYLSIECEIMGNRHVGELFFQVYKQLTNDSIPTLLIAFYKAKKAFIRAYLVARHWEEACYRNDPRWMKKANAYLQLSKHYLQEAAA